MISEAASNMSSEYLSFILELSDIDCRPAVQFWHLKKTAYYLIRFGPIVLEQFIILWLFHSPYALLKNFKKCFIIYIPDILIG